MHLNIALCNLKLNRNAEARHECDEVLNMDPKNEKALFRRGLVVVIMSIISSFYYLKYMNNLFTANCIGLHEFR